MEEQTDPPIEATPEPETEAVAAEPAAENAEPVAEEPAAETAEPVATPEAEEQADEPQEPTVVEEGTEGGAMDVDEPPTEEESQATDEPVTEEVDRGQDDTPAVEEPAQPETAEEAVETPETAQPQETEAGVEEHVDECEAPHAMEVSDFNEHEHDHDAVVMASATETNALMDTDDHDKTANDTEKSMEASTMDVSASDDPFDSLRTATDAEKTGEQEKSTVNSERDPDDTAEDNEDNGHDDGEEAADETAETENQTAEDADQPDDAANDVTEEHEGVDEDLCLLPDEEREITEAEKEQAILAIEESEKAPEETEVTESETGVEDTEKDDDVVEVAPEEPATEEAAAPATEAGVEATTEPASGEAPASEDAPAAEGTDSPPAPAPVAATPAPQPHVGEKVSIWQIIDTTKACLVCKEDKPCKYRYKEETEAEFNYICDTKCIERHAAPTPGKFLIKRKKYVIQETVGDDQEAVHFCVHCSEDKKCKYYFEQQEENFYVCEEDCLNLLLSEHTDRLRKRTVRVRNLTAAKPAAADPDASKIVARSEEEAEALRQEREASFIRRCMQCFNLISISARTIQWETMDFCNEKCLGTYQNVVGANCTTCCQAVPLASLGKYCVRFGFDIRQFCSSSCLDTFKKKLRVCSYCQNDIPGKAGMLAPVGDKGQFKDFCTKLCLKKYEELVGHKKKTGSHVCSVCNLDQPVKVTIVLDMKEHNFCSQPCFSAFKFVNNVNPDECTMCCKYFERKQTEAYTIYQDNIGKVFCSKICFNIYIIMNRKIVACSWCKVKKYNFDMIHKLYNDVSMCSLNCLTLCEVSMNAIAMKRIKCDHCKTLKQPQYHLTMSDASIRNFCTYQCVMSFQSQFNKQPLTLDAETATSTTSAHPVPTGLPKRVKKSDQAPAKTMPATKKSMGGLVISNVESLASNRGRGRPSKTNDASTGSSINLSQLPELRVNLEPLPNLPTKRVRLTNRMVSTGTYAGMDNDDYSAEPSPPPPPRELPPKIELRTQVIHMPSLPAQVANAIVQVRPMTEDKGVLCKPVMEDKATQTDAYLQRKIVIPIPVPIYVPTPMHMYSLPLPIPVPLALPVPVPVFIPTTRNAAPGIMKEIKKIQDKMPTDPFEAELLMMAEMVAGDAKKEDEPSDEEVIETTNHFNDGIENNTSFNEDLVQMALKMASNDYEEPVVDLESAMHTSTINQSQMMDNSAYSHHQMMMMEQQQQPQRAQRGRKRQVPAAAPAPVQNQRTNNRGAVAANKRQKRDDVYDTSMQDTNREPTEKPDANMCLKYTFGVNAWKQWVMTKNADLEKSTIRRKPFKSEILQLTADELNFSLCLFVKEVRKPNGSEYAPDTIYYLVLGIQQYLFENGRIDNIFTDPYYERFTDCLDEVAKKFSVLYNDSQYIVTRVEEEHLWECKQLGAHSPHVLLSTLMFFNTKHFNLVTVEEHMELSFSHIMKHWKRNPNSSGAAQKTPGSRNVLLRFYPPQASLVNNSRKKKVYEQQENEENPLRCPVKLYEFYLSKCPESVKTRNDVFYLQPERSCVPDSPVWYSTQALNREGLSKMLHRVKMVKEINIALLTS